STQPAFPSRVRTRYQSSAGTGLGGSPAATAGSPPRSDARGRDSSTQLAGGDGAGGGGGGGTSLLCLAVLSENLSDDLSNFDPFLLEPLVFLIGATAGGITAFRGETRCTST